MALQRDTKWNEMNEHMCCASINPFITIRSPLQFQMGRDNDCSNEQSAAMVMTHDYKGSPALTSDSIPHSLRPFTILKKPPLPQSSFQLLATIQ